MAASRAREGEPFGPASGSRRATTTSAPALSAVRWRDWSTGTPSRPRVERRARWPVAERLYPSAPQLGGSPRRLP